MGRLIDADELERYIDNCDFCDRCPDASPRCQIDCEMPDFLTKRWKRVIDAQPTVDAQAEIDRLNRLGLTWYDTILKLMEMVNGTEKVTRCKDCKWCRTFYHGPDMRLNRECLKLYLTSDLEDNDFCSRGERKEE